MEKLFVAGRLVIPIYFPIFGPPEDALKNVRNEINNHTIMLIDGDIYTCDGGSYSLIAKNCRIEWTDVVSQDDVV